MYIIQWLTLKHWIDLNGVQTDYASRQRPVWRRGRVWKTKISPRRLMDQAKMTSAKLWDFFTLPAAIPGIAIGIITSTQLIRTVFCFWDNTLSLNADVHYGRSLTMGSPLHSRDGGRWERRREEGWSSDDSAADESRHCHCQWHANWEENHHRTQRNSTLHGLPLRLLTSFY